jgi:hypothetical protein
MKTAVIAAGALLILLIAAVVVVGIQVAPKSAQSSSILASSTATGSSASSTGPVVGTTSSTTSSESSSIASTTQTTSTASTTASQQGSTGDFAMMATDPPVVASGVTAATDTYSSLAVHTAGDSNSTGWIQLNGTGTINLMSSESVSQTIAAAQIQSGTYDMVQMGIQSASVTYNNQVYAAAVASGIITAKLQTQVQVSGSQSSAAIVDLRTFVMNTGGSSSPQFVFSACAKATTVPPSQMSSSSLQVGAQTQLQGSWWVGFKDQTSTNLNISSATLSSGSLDLQLKNSGNDSADVQTIVITPVSGSATTTAALPASMSGSAVFTVNSAGSLQASNTLQGAVLLSGASTQLAAGSSTTLDYSGSISLGFGIVGIQLTGVVAGQQYLVTVMGANTFGSILVTAQ